MRLWSLHPSCLDAKGLVALWREGLLARKVLAGKTRGYRHHPQLLRFRAAKNPMAAIDAYLSAVLAESLARGYSFDASKIRRRRSPRLTVTRGQVAYERKHLLAKLAHRDRGRWKREKGRAARLHPLFWMVAGPIASWEVVK